MCNFINVNITFVHKRRKNFSNFNFLDIFRVYEKTYIIFFHMQLYKPVFIKLVDHYYEFLINTQNNYIEKQRIFLNHTFNKNDVLLLWIIVLLERWSFFRNYSKTLCISSIFHYDRVCGVHQKSCQSTLKSKLLTYEIFS